MVHSRVRRTVRAAVTMVLFAFPLLLLAWAIRQRVDLVLVLDDEAVTAATSTT